MSRSTPAVAVLILGLTTSGCAMDQETWDGIIMGLEQTAAELDYQNRNCYWAAPPNMPYAAARQYCPGDIGYIAPVAYVPCAPRDRDCDGYRDRPRRDRDRHDDDRDHRRHD